MTAIGVRPMTQEEFGAWQHQVARAYADEQVAAGSWPAEGALERALEGNVRWLPQGLDTPDMLLLRAVLPDGAPVGRVWIGLRHPKGAPDCGFLYDIEVDAEHRRRGLGRALLEQAELAVRARGVGSLELDVFGSNTGAVGLYASAGYVVVTQQMRKHLRTAD
ncbi:GNAT family N-acetyltransferase [Pseudokineococcus sp. 5B2Z-1]|uniref:GNAT family N-acetyltransferase n=1 Tax=Pseudokineococcus sp. 5B2Z-1 TaxID=3132744 RepID=UPI0030AFF25A